MNIKNKVNLNTLWDTYLKDYQSNTHSTELNERRWSRTHLKMFSPTMGRSIMEGYSHRIGNSKYHR